MPAIENLKRVRYFTGQTLSSQDLRDEQNYFLGRMRRHNRYLHGWGVVHGLAVRMVGEGEIEVSPGMAIDCAGNEVVLSMAMRATIPPSTVKLYVTITYCESETDPVPVISGDPEYTRTLEGATLAFSDANPGRLHHGMGPRTSGCGLCHAVSLAALTRHGGGWRIQRRRHGA